MDRGGASMDAGQDVWDWEVLQPDQMSSSMCQDGTNLADDQETKERIIVPPSSGVDVPVDECKDIGVVLDETVPNEEEAVPGLTVASASEAEQLEEKTIQSTDAKKVHEEKFDEEEEATAGEVEEKTIQSPDAKKDHDEKSDAVEAAEEVGEKAFQSSDTKKDHGEKLDQEEEEDAVKKARPDCVVFSVGKLKVNGIGALCSFGVAAATVCIFLIGGKLQHHHRQQQQHKIQLQFYGDDKRIQQVVQQTSRLNQAMSSVMGGGASTRANISFGGFYDGL